VTLVDGMDEEVSKLEPGYTDGLNLDADVREAQGDQDLETFCAFVVSGNILY
jgi:hypothetical protein